MRNFGRSLLLLCGFLIFSAGSVYLQNYQLERLRNQPWRYHDWLHLPSGEYVERMAIGYDHAAADFLWLRAIQVFGATFAREEFVDQLAQYFDVITDLDPHFMPAYSFGNMVLGEEAGDDEKALALLDKGIEKNPDHYQPAYEAAFYAYWHMNDPKLAKEYVYKALEAKNAPDFLESWLAFFDRRLGRYEAAYETYAREFVKYFNRDEHRVADIKHKNLRRAIKEWYLRDLWDIAVEWRETHGRNPTVEELGRAGAFRDITWPDWQAMSRYIDNMLAEGRKIPADTEEQFQNFIHHPAFFHDGWERMPPNPASDNRHLPGWAIWPGQEPYVFSENARGEQEGMPIKEKNRLFCDTELQMAFRLLSMMEEAKANIRQYQETHDGECPPDLAEVHSRLHLFESDPWGGQIVLNREECTVETTTFDGNLMEYYLEDPPI